MSQSEKHPSVRRLSLFDQLLTEINAGLNTLAHTKATRSPRPDQQLDSNLTTDQSKQSAALMRINHVGEVCAQALYRGQAFFAEQDNMKSHLLIAAEEEHAHLSWCQARLHELDSHPSLLNPFWYGASFVIGASFAKLGDRISLGFVEETEYQVMAHLEKHLNAMPEQDTQSRAILKKMHQDEAHHAQSAKERGATELPMPIKIMMKVQSKVMTTLARHI